MNNRDRELMEKSEIKNAEGFLNWLSSISNTYSSPEKEELIKEFITSKLTPEVAWDIISNEKNCERFQYLIKEDLDFILKLYTLASKTRIYPQAYPEMTISLIYLYQNKTTQKIALNVVYDLLLIQEFRNSFKDDKEFVPFFMEGFYDDLSNHIQSKCDDTTLKEILLDSCKSRQFDSKFADAELIKVFKYKEPLTPEQTDILAIQKFLGNVSNDSAVMKQLGLLEQELEKRAGPRYNADTKLLEGYTEGKPFQHKKLLSDFLRQFAEENKFVGYGKLKGFLMPHEFFNFLSKGGLFKDTVLQGEFHGDFTHFIQFYLITMWNNENPEKPKLNCHPRDLLQWIGKNENFNEWSQTFEGSIKSLYKPTLNDFRRVDGLHKYLNSPDCPFPVLHQLNKGRAAKGSKPYVMYTDTTPIFDEFKPKPKK